MSKHKKYIITGFVLFFIYTLLKIATTTKLVQFKYKLYLLFWLPILIITLIVVDRIDKYNNATNGRNFFTDRYTNRIKGSNITDAIISEHEDKKFEEDSHRNLAVYQSSQRPSGIFFGVDDKRQYVYDNPSESGAPHVFIIGGTGSGKTQNIILPTITTWPASDHIFALDISGDITGTIDANKGLRPDNYIKLDLEDWHTTIHYDPFAAAKRIGDEKRAEGVPSKYAEGYEENELEKIANCIVPFPSQNESSNRYFRDGARTFCLAALVHGYFAGWSFGQTVKWANEQGIMGIMGKVLKNGRKSNAARISGFIGQNEKNLSGIDGEMKTFTQQLIKIPHLIDLLSPPPDDNSLLLTPDMMESHDIFVKCNIDQLSNYNAVIGLIFSQFFDYMYRRPLNTDHPILVICDELASYIRGIGINAFCDHIRNLRKHGIRIMLAVQDFSSLDAVAGEAARRTIWNNAGWQVVLLSRDPKTSRELSETVGKEKRIEYIRSTNNTGSSTMSRQTRLEDVIPPEDFSTLVNQHKLILLGNQGYQILNTCPFWQHGAELIKLSHQHGQNKSHQPLVPPSAGARSQIYRPGRSNNNSGYRWHHH